MAETPITDKTLDVIASILHDPKLTAVEKRQWAADRLPALHAELADIQESIVDKEQRIEALRGLMKWLSEPPALERNDHSRLHKLVEAARSGRVIDAEEGEVSRMEHAEPYWHTLHPFVVKHDWLAAFGDALGDVAEDFRLPYDSSAFEFRINGRNVIVVAWEHEGAALDQLRRAALAFIEVGDVWLLLGKRASDYPPTRFAWEQIVAISVALDASVATHEVQRAPAALNKKRARAGNVPLYDFHVVNLARRVRAAPNHGAHSDRHPRLHFRRGHWRHYEKHKTWINWMLVGDPNLGFIASHYSL